MLKERDLCRPPCHHPATRPAMSTPAATITTKLTERFSLAQSVITIVVTVCTVLLSVGVFYGGIVYRVASAESENLKQDKTIEQNRQETEQKLGGKLDEKVYEADKRFWVELKKTVDEIRRDQIEDLKDRAAGRGRESHPRSER